MNKQNYKEVSTIGRWGRMHGRYLKDNHPVRYTVLLLSGKLNGYLVEFDQQAEIVYSLSHKKLLELASDAGAIYRFDSTVLINREIFDAYLERFHEPARKITVEEVEDE